MNNNINKNDSENNTIKTFDTTQQTRNLSINDAKAIELLQQRAKHLAQLDSNEKSKRIQFLRLAINDQDEFGIPYQHLEEILKPNEITTVPAAPAYISGTINRRSQLLPVLDLRYFLQLEQNLIQTEPWVVVITVNKITLGVLATQVYENEFYDPKELKPALNIDKEIPVNFVTGI
ncbi:MAG: chemotaxis protein CheW, partial [Gammaproteobacteria bacterium]|nr:chemotaxis protein CheW [Gammaproteobacteria bacterium]